MKNPKSKSGNLFLIIGNSGSGKDSLIQWVLNAWPTGKLPPFVPTRLITRPPSPETEGFESISEEQFHQMAGTSAFSLQWKSYGNYYGVRKDIESELAKGHSVLVNVSRQIVEKTRKQFPKVVIIFIRVPFQITEARIRSRGREEGSALESRLKRARKNPEFASADYIIDNSGDIEKAGQQLLDILLTINSSQ
jgi:ribose 1,5-bisphosphokinase